MVKLLSVIVILFTGCTSTMDRQKQEIACEPYGGIYDSGFNSLSSIRCMDGTRVRATEWYAIKGKKLAERMKTVKE